MGWASFSDKATYLQPGWDDLLGNHEFIVFVEDYGEPSKGIHQMWLEMHDRVGDVFPTLSMGRNASDNAETIKGGNIVVPH